MNVRWRPVGKGRGSSVHIMDDDGLLLCGKQLPAKTKHGIEATDENVTCKRCIDIMYGETTPSVDTIVKPKPPMMDVVLDHEHSITADENNWIIRNRHHVPIGYFGDLPSLLRFVLNSKIKSQGATTIKDLMDVCVQARKEMNGLAQTILDKMEAE